MTLISVLRHVLLLACISMCLLRKATADSYADAGSYAIANSYASSGSNGPPQVCLFNEEYNDCGTACPEICDEPTPEVCTLQCVGGCFCKEGFIRITRGGGCIPKSHCLKEPVPGCPLYEEYNDCGSACEPSCDKRGPQIQGCAAVCVKGCFCQPGYIRISQGGLCIPENACPPTIPNPTGPPGICYGVNEEYNICGSACPPICDEHKFKILGCTAQCVEGCYCKRGFIRDTRGGICIPESLCPNKPIPVTCRINEEYNDCGSACPPVCDQLGSQVILACPAVCVQGCFCKPDFIRSTKGGICIPEIICKAIKG